MHIVTLSPAFQWAQSLDNVFISVKFATRFDSPGCLDIFDKEIVLNETHFDMAVFCRIDKKVMKYELALEFFEPIDVN